MTAIAALGPDLLAQPPVDAVFNLAAANLVTAVYGISAAVILLWALSRPGARVIVPAMLVGGAFATLVEPIVDVLGGAFHPLIGQNTVFTLFGRGMPLWVVTIYIFYYGGIGSLMLLAFNKGISRAAIWAWVVAPLVFDPVAEFFMLRTKLYYYYGQQPLVVLHFPLYQAAGNASGLILGVASLYFMQPYLRGWRWFPAAIFVLPFCGIMGWCATGMFSFAAVHSAWPGWAVQLSGLATCALAVMLVSIVANLIGTDSPLRSRLARSGFGPAVQLGE